MEPSSNTATDREHARHPRTLGENRYVYAVLSRRSGGISIGVNLNPDKRCNFDCIYCQVDRTAMPQPGTLDATAVARLTLELADTLAAAADGSLFRQPRFADLPEAQQVVRDVALSGDGEPTSIPGFSEAVSAIVATVNQSPLGPVPVILITNAAGLDRPGVKEGVHTLMAAGGQIWAKLDAGTEAYYQTVCATHVPFAKILANIGDTAARWPVTLQTCLFRLQGQPPPVGEIDEYVARVREFADKGHIASIQLYTVARPPAQGAVTPLSESELADIAEKIESSPLNIPVFIYP